MRGKQSVFPPRLNLLRADGIRNGDVKPEKATSHNQQRVIPFNLRFEF